MKVGDKVIIKGRTGDLGGVYIVLCVYEDRLIVKHPDYSVSFLVDKKDCVKSLNKS